MEDKKSKDNSEARIQQYIAVYELYATAIEGLSYLSKHPHQNELLNDTVTAIAAIGLNLEKLTGTKDEKLRTSETELRSRLVTFNSRENVTIDASRWHDNVSRLVFSAILDEINAAESVSASCAQAALACAEASQLSATTKSVIFFSIAQKCGRTDPVLSHEYMLNAFELNPEVLYDKLQHLPEFRYVAHEQITFEQCPVCKHSECTPYYNACSCAISSYTTISLPAKLWLKCEHCGNLYSYKFSKVYLQSPASQKKISPNRGPDDCTLTNAPVGLNLWGGVLNLIREYTDGNKVLEVGIGQGHFIAAALEMGYQVDSIEIREETSQTVANILNVDVWCCDFLRYETDKRYSVITMGDVIEHVTDPEQALRKAHALLEDHGALWLSTPNCESAFSRLRKWKDPMWSEPGHISYFSYSGLKALAKTCGFTVRNYSISARYNGSMELILTKTPTAV